MILVKMKDKMNKIIYINPIAVDAIYEQPSGMFGILMRSQITYLFNQENIDLLLNERVLNEGKM